MTPEKVYDGLWHWTRETCGGKLFTVTLFDVPAGLVRRVYSSHPKEFPLSGQKPIIENVFTDRILGEQSTFICNDVFSMPDQFPDADVITTLGCGASANVPIVENGEVIATLNLLDEMHSFGPERSDIISREMPIAGLKALQHARALGEMV